MKKELKKLQNKVFLLIICMALIPTSVLFAQKKAAINTTEKISIKSKALNEERVVTVCLPVNYKTSSQKYPVVYLLDGRAHFEHFTSAVNFLSMRGIIPQMIVVAVHNVNRNRDFSPIQDKRMKTSGGAEKFSNYVSGELMKKINKDYRTSDFTVLMGHSFGGTYAAYSLLEKPEVFDGYIAISPYLHFMDNYLVKQAKVQLKPKYKTQKHFYMTVGNEPLYFSALGEFSELVKEKSSNAINLKYVKMPDEDHGSIPYLSAFNGLRFVFSDWQIPMTEIDKGLAVIDEHYKKVSAKYNIKTQASENLINRLGYWYLQKKEIDKAIEVFSENVKRVNIQDKEPLLFTRSIPAKIEKIS